MIIAPQRNTVKNGKCSTSTAQIAKGQWTTVGALGAEVVVRCPFAHRFSGGPLVSYNQTGPLFCYLL